MIGQSPHPLRGYTDVDDRGSDSADDEESTGMQEVVRGSHPEGLEGRLADQVVTFGNAQPTVIAEPEPQPANQHRRRE